ncbi:tetratricopeptide repeat protein, partial [Nostoc sp. 106C]|uniref:tetratricopeptide repeat protein n=1 Tax=Nostoc sp. 106C TaxID=1932667 RepID=UPI000B6AD840
MSSYKFKLYSLSSWRNISAVIATGGKQSQAPAIALSYYVPPAMTRLRLFINIQLICLLSAVLLSESVGAKVTLKQMQIAQQPTITQPNATRAAAKKVFDEGTALYKQDTPASLRQAIEKWQEALVLWQKAGDKKGQAVTLLSIGRVYDALEEKQKALEYYNSALPLYRAVGDRSGE